MNGPVINPKSGIVHDKAIADEGVAKCGVVVSGFLSCADLEEAPRRGTFCKKCYPA